MSFANLQSDGNLGIKSVKLEPQHDGDLVPLQECRELLKSKSSYQGESDERQSSNVLSSAQSGTSMLDQGQSPLEDTGLSSLSTICQAPLCRQFWKSGEYSDAKRKKVSVQSGTNYLHVHPMFLHSNATSHKWAFGAIAELLDNAVDEIESGATFVIVDKASNPKDGSPALLIQDDGGGMDPDKIRECMSFGFSDKQSKSTIGRYGNGFKTSSMRLGADVIVFSCHQNDKLLTKSVGLLSYTFLMRTGYDRIIVPMVDYEFNASIGKFKISSRYSKAHFASNLSLLLHWSPYSTEEDLLKQFDDIGSHGTKVIIYNLWCNDDGDMELDFDSDPKDILLSGEIKKLPKKVNVEHLANRLHYSLHVYLSILYLRIPESFKIILRGQVVEHHNIADDLKFYEYILYKPQSGRTREGEVVTTIGFLKEAPLVNIHGFNVYHRNRLILPFWQVVNYADSRGRGVVGVLEANFIEPTHNKQDFERTSLFQKLENRLKEMTWEYWDYHCGLIGYQVKKKPREPVPPVAPCHNVLHIGIQKPVMLGPNSPSMNSINMNGASSGTYKSRYALVDAGSRIKRKASVPIGIERTKRHQSVESQAVQEPVQIMGGSPTTDQEATIWMQEHQKLRAECVEYEKNVKELEDKLLRLNMELKVARHEYKRLLSEAQLLDQVKQEKVPMPPT